MLYELIAQNDAPAQVAPSVGWIIFGVSLILLAGTLLWFLRKND